MMALPAGVVAWLEQGIDVCGSEHVLALLAKRFPRSRFVGYTADGMQTATFDLVVMTEVLHDMHVLRRALKPSGILLCLGTGLQAELAAFAREAGLSFKVLDTDLYAVHV